MKLKKCPSCRSANIARHQRHPEKPDGTFYDACRDCMAIWESIPQGEQYKRDGELMAFHEPCDNCAFRPGSPESHDKAEWRKLMDKLRAGGSFLCHKGVPIKSVGEGSRADFDFQCDASGLPAPERSRLCRGYLNAWSNWTRQKYGTYENPKPMPASTVSEERS
jgi:hypothetical protein